MSKETFWKKLAEIMLLLGIGILAGILIGMPIGEQKGRRDAQEAFNGQKQELQGITEEVLPTTGPEPTLTPEVTQAGEGTSSAPVQPTLAPEVTQAGEGTPSAPVQPTLAPEVTQAGEGTPTASLQPTTEPVVTPVGDVTPTVTAKPATTPKPTATAKPVTTPKPAVTAKPITTPKVTITPTPTVKPTEIPTATGENGYYGRLHVEGSYLADNEDKLVQLRGISTHGIGWFPQYVNETAIRQFNEEWGCNVFRLAMYTAEGAGYCTNGDAQKEKLKEIIHTGVTAAIRQDMYVIIDWHVLNDRDPNLYKDEAKKFFAEMAKNYGDDSHVIYEICNEPNSGVAWSQIKSYALEVIPVIREYAPNAVIIVGTPTWSQDVDVAAKDPIVEYDNIMYALHFYAETHQDSLRNKCKTAVAKGLPLFVTEYGICDASGNGIINETQANIWIDFLDSYGISHVAWNLSNKNESSSMIAAGCSKVNGFTKNDLSAGGKWFVDMLKKAGVGVGSALSGTTEAGQGDNNGNGSSSGESTGTSGNNTAESGGTAGQIMTVEKVTEILTAGDGLSYSVSNSWTMENGMGVQLVLTVKNESSAEITDWERRITVKEGATVEIEQNWNSTVTKEGNMIVIKPVDYNKVIAAGGSVGDIGLILNVAE